MELDYIYIGNYKIGLYNNGPVGVGVSGGADSAILLYILMSNIKQTIHIYNMMAEYRRPILEQHFDSVVETCSNLTGNKNYIVHKHYVEPDESAEFYIKMLTHALNTSEVDIVYLGLTKFPPKQEYLSWPGQQPDWHNDFRSDEIEKPLFGFSIPVSKTNDFKTVPLTIDGNPIDKLELDERAYIPFFNCNKKDIALLYNELQLEHSLLPVTRSCENDQHPASHCNECWWCRERIWAFGYTDGL
jgi:7-cyano-7-deazaguanine synthase in queuosine biosynthesis